MLGIISFLMRLWNICVRYIATLLYLQLICICICISVQQREKIDEIRFVAVAGVFGGGEDGLVVAARFSENGFDGHFG